MHGWTSTQKMTKMYLYQYLDALALQRVEKIVIVSRAMLSNPKIKKLPNEKLKVIENGIGPLPGNHNISSKEIVCDADINIFNLINNQKKWSKQDHYRINR